MSTINHGVPDPEEFDHVEDWTEKDFEDLEEDGDIEKEHKKRGGCMPDPEDFDD
jgi:hypothetical protein